MVATYAVRQHVKPGMTGWAQVQGLRGNTAHLSLMEARILQDIWYIDHWSPWLDIWIMLKTGLEVLRQDTAY